MFLVWSFDQNDTQHRPMETTKTAFSSSSQHNEHTLILDKNAVLMDHSQKQLQ